MKVWWQNLNERERLWVTLAGVLVAAMLLWLTLGKALLGHYQLLQHDLTTAREVQQKCSSSATPLCRHAANLR